MKSDLVVYTASGARVTNLKNGWEFKSGSATWRKNTVAWSLTDVLNFFQTECCKQGRIKGGGNGGNCPGPPATRGIPWWDLFVSNKILV